MSKLFMMKVDSEYITAPTKILFVGAETHGWDHYHVEDTPESLMNLYQQVSRSGKHHSSPFWWFRERCSKAFGLGDDYMRSSLWTNLSKFDVNKTTPYCHRFYPLIQEFINLLISEIGIIKPDLIIIMTSNGCYQWNLENYNWLNNIPYDEKNKNENCLLRNWIIEDEVSCLGSHNRLPANTYNIWHPNRINFVKGKFYDKSDRIINAIAQSMQ